MLRVLSAMFHAIADWAYLGAYLPEKAIFDMSKLPRPGILLETVKI